MVKNIGERMKENYEFSFRSMLPMRFPTILRVDGRCFHSFTRSMVRPFDETFMENMEKLALYLCQEVATTQIAYIQSDEISLLLHPYKKLDSQGWFANEIQKMVSIAAGLASCYFSLLYQRPAVFDARVFVLPEAEVANYFLWRQQDATRNSIQMLAQSLYSQKHLHQKNTSQMQDMMMEKGVNWNNLDVHKKRGWCIQRNDEGVWTADRTIPVFSQDRVYIERHLVLEEA